MRVKELFPLKGKPLIINYGQLLPQTAHRNESIGLEQELLICDRWPRRAQNEKFLFAVRNLLTTAVLCFPSFPCYFFKHMDSQKNNINADLLPIRASKNF